MKTVSTGSFFLLMVLWLGGCATTPMQDQHVTTCTSRSPVCTQDYTPVCGRHSEQGWKTYANACNACADAQVEGYTPGECP